MMLARKVLWDEDIGFDIAQFSKALDTTPAVVSEVLNGLEREGWVVIEPNGERPILTDRGRDALLGRRGSAAGPSGGEPQIATPTALSAAPNSFGR